MVFGRWCSTALVQPCRCTPQLFFRLGRGVFYSTSGQPPAAVALMAHVALLRPVAPFTLALLRGALGRFLGRWYFTYQRSSPGAVDRADDVPALWQVILEYPSGSPPNSRQTFLRPLPWRCSPCARAAGGFIHTGAILSALGRWCLRQCALGSSPGRPVASSAPLLQGGSSSL